MLLVIGNPNERWYGSRDHRGAASPHLAKHAILISAGTVGAEAAQLSMDPGVIVLRDVRRHQ